MIIAQEKRHSNIAEYILYMWQVEDLLRACCLDEEEIEQKIVSRFDLPAEQMKAVRQWYIDMAGMMKAEQLDETGHLQINRNTLNDVADLHHRLLNSSVHPGYVSVYYRALPSIVELRARVGNDAKGEVETCFDALYMTLLLRLQGKPVSHDTQEALAKIAALIALLTDFFHKQEREPDEYLLMER